MITVIAQVNSVTEPANVWVLAWLAIMDFWPKNDWGSERGSTTAA